MIHAGLLVFALAAATHTAPDAADASPNPDYLGYFLSALSSASYLHSSLTVPGSDVVASAYYSYQLVRDMCENRTPTDVLNSTNAFAQAAHAAALAAASLSGAAIPNLVLLKGGTALLSTTTWGLSYAPAAWLWMQGGALPGLQERYDLSLFTRDSQQSTYLACAYPDAEGKAARIVWPEEHHLQDGNPASYANGYVVLRGRWVWDAPRYVFATIDDPLKVQAACVNAVAEALTADGTVLDDVQRIGLAAGDTYWQDAASVAFYVPRLSLHPSSSRYRRRVVKQAVLLNANLAPGCSAN